MPRRKFTRRRKPNNWSRARTAISVAQQAWKTAKYVKSLVNVERKFIDILAQGIANTSFTSVGVVGYLSGVAQGTDYNTRNGNSIKVSSMNFKCTINVGSSNTSIRIIIFKDMEQRGTLPVISDLLEQVDVRSPLNHVNGSRFKVLRDWFLNLQTVNITSRVIKYFTKRNFHIKYNGTSATTATAEEGNVYIMFLSETASGAASPTAFYSNRIRFIDN